VIRPAALGSGARVALVAPAGPLQDGAVDRAVERVESWGWVPVPGEHVRVRRGYLSGSDKQRLHDLNTAIRSPDVDAIWLLRGGYGTMRILDRVDWPALRKRPRPLIGFSDNTALHLAARRAGIVTFHGPHSAVEDLPGFSADALRAALTSTAPAGVLPMPPGQSPRTLVPGAAEGPLVGGNLSILAALCGTIYQMDARGAVLFVEEVGEPAYRVDRLLSQLRMSGALDGVQGIAVGSFTANPDEDRADLPSAAEVFLDRLDGLGVPLAVGFPFGHIAHNWTLPVGARARLDASAGTLELLESGVV
jgi:muramoyltetrapeptide carboxypeptidase